MVSLLILLAVCVAVALMLLFGFTAWWKQQPIRAVVLVSGGLFILSMWNLVGLLSILEAAARAAGIK